MPIRRTRPAEAKHGTASPNLPKKRIVRTRPQPEANSGKPSEASTTNEENYEVGYCKPPKSTQFKKGKSGNPNGRPKGAKGLNSIVKDNLLERVAVRTVQGTKRLTRIEALVLKLLEAAGGGDHRALVQLMSMYSAAVPEAAPEITSSDNGELTDTDEAILANFLERYAQQKEATS
ncbi:MAG: DUF5681 domain-containing protein [Marinomonas sp.]